jgi:hypothetical protein
MSDEPKKPSVLIDLLDTNGLIKLFLALVSALLGTNLYQGAVSNKELTREQSAWDTEALELVLRKLDRIEAKMNP